jgi:hypothetical protein
MSPLCEHGASLFEYVDRHAHHGDGTYPLAHHPVTSFSVSGPMCFPLALRLYRRDEELTPWETWTDWISLLKKTRNGRFPARRSTHGKRLAGIASSQMRISIHVTCCL